MSMTLHLYAADSSLAKVTGCVGLLCEFAPDSPVLSRGQECYSPDEILGSPDEALKIASELVSKLLQSAPSIDGLAVLGIFEETLLEQVSYIVQAFHLDRWISSRRVATCHFTSYSAWLERLREVRAFSGSSYSLTPDVTLLQNNRGSRAIRRMWQSRPTPVEFFRRVAPHWTRWISGTSMRKHARSARRGGIWFYSTAYNFTKIGLEYEPYLPEKMNFLVEDPSTGGRRLRELGRDWHSLYQWSRARDVPARAEADSAGERITRAVAAIPLSEEENALRAVLLASEWWHLFLTRRLPFALFNSRALDRWRKAVAPEMIVVGNAGWERALLLHESVQRVPIVLLQHGVMHWVYAVSDEPVDIFLLRGAFFQRCISENLQVKTVIQNFPEPSNTSAAQEEHPRTDILFITTPYDVPVLFHLEDRRDILRSLLRVSHESARRLMIRVHPLERISTYEREVSALEEELGIRADVGYSQGPGVDAVLARSCVAVLYFSAMFLDCLRHGVPIISFDWHWFPNKLRFEEENIFTFATDLKHFEELLGQGIAGKLPRQSAGIEEFLSPAQPENISSLFKEIWDARSNAGSGFWNAPSKTFLSRM